MGNVFNRINKSGPKYREIVPNPSVDDNIPFHHKNHPNRGFRSNEVNTTKYTVLTFIPKNLFEQFHRYANLFFIFVVCLNFIPEIEAFLKEIAWVPVFFVLSVTAVKDAFEDFRRYRSDKKINHTPCRIYSKKGKTDKFKYNKQEWYNVRVGDFVHLSCNEIIPADILFLRSSDDAGICHIETSNLDGETNLKQREVVIGLQEQGTQFSPENFTYKVQCEQPNSEIYRFHGAILQENSRKIAIDKNNLLLRGCTIRNTDFIEGIVVYAGHETKAMLNNRGPRYKRSKLERAINLEVIWCVVLMLFMCFFCAIGSGIFVGSYDDSGWTPFNPVSEDTRSAYSPYFQAFIVFWTYLATFQTVIPLPLYVSLEVVKLVQIYFINCDLEIYYEPTDKRTECRALNITEDLGQIEYVFSDKTGTLTENIMEFKSCSIGGVDFPHNADEEDSHSDCESRQSVLTLASRNSSIYENLKLEPEIQRDLSSMCLRSLDSIDLHLPLQSRQSKRVQEFFLLLAVCNTVVVSHHPHEDKMNDSGDIVNDHEKVKDPMQPVERYTKLPDISFPLAVDRAAMQNLASSMDKLDLGRESPTPTVSIDGSASYISDGSISTQYEAESPDELALVKAATTYGCRLLKRSPDRVTVWLPAEGEVEFEVLNVLHFDATRKRMSVIIRHPGSGEITLYTKGADNNIISVLHKSYREDDELKQMVDTTIEHLEGYAYKGLRTLCMSKKVITTEDYQQWCDEHKAAESAMENREEKVFESVCRIENDLELLGATGIEDKLQPGVPETISALRKAGIKVWVLTGDKQETAIQIAYACKLFSQDQERIIVNARDKEQTLDLLEHYLDQIKKEESGYELQPESSRHRHKHKKTERAMVIDGKTLAYAFDEMAEKKFLELCKKCSSVVCCRVSPIQKSNVVKLVKEHMNKMTLAIGDGANDVSMIQTADIGIGISGQEGMQAVMSSDFAIARFQFLQRLLLVHGHWCYDRLAKFAAFMFYKSMISVFVMFWFQIYNGFSGSIPIDSFYLMFIHLLFTAMPPLVNGVFDKDVESDLLLSHPKLYRHSQGGKMYTKWTFLVTMIDSMWQSLSIYFLAQLAYGEHGVPMWEFGTTTYTATILTILLHNVIETSSWIWIQWVTILASFLLFWMFAVVSNAVFFTISAKAYMYWVMQSTISSPDHSLIIALTVVTALLPRLTVRLLQNSINPTEIQLVKQHRKIQLQRQKSERSTADSIRPNSARHPVDTETNVTTNTRASNGNVIRNRVLSTSSNIHV